MTVRLGEVSNCTTSADETRQRSAVTESDGTVEFPAVSDRAYLVTVEPQGGFEGRQDCLNRIRPGTSYSQIELRPDLSQQVTLIQPAIEEPSTPRRLGLGDFVGVYTDAAGQFYEVTILDGPAGVALSLPGGGVLRFPERQGSSFHGRDGTISFTVERGRVTGFSVTRTTLSAKKRG
jgi:hypothetical protein